LTAFYLEECDPCGSEFARDGGLELLQINVQKQLSSCSVAFSTVPVTFTSPWSCGLSLRQRAITLLGYTLFPL